MNSVLIVCNDKFEINSLGKVFNSGKIMFSKFGDSLGGHRFHVILVCAPNENLSLLEEESVINYIQSLHNKLTKTGVLVLL